MSMQTLTWDVDAAAVAGNNDTYSLASATQARQKPRDKNHETTNDQMCKIFL